MQNHPLWMENILGHLYSQYTCTCISDWNWQKRALSHIYTVPNFQPWQCITSNYSSYIHSYMYIIQVYGQGILSSAHFPSSIGVEPGCADQFRKSPFMSRFEALPLEPGTVPSLLMDSDLLHVGLNCVQTKREGQGSCCLIMARLWKSAKNSHFARSTCVNIRRVFGNLDHIWCMQKCTYM